MGWAREKAGVAVILIAAAGYALLSSGTGSTLVLNADCRDSGEIVVDGTRWILDQGSDVPRSWRGRGEVEGVVVVESDGSGRFVALDGTTLPVTTGFRKMSCSLWD